MDDLDENLVSAPTKTAPLGIQGSFAEQLRHMMGQPIEVITKPGVVIKGKVKALSPKHLLLTEIAGREAMDALLSMEEVAGIIAPR